MSSGRNFLRLAIAIMIITVIAQLASGQRASKRPELEYCAITEIRAPFTNTPQADAMVTATAIICYFQRNGCKREEVKFDASTAELTTDMNPRDRLGGGAMYLVRERTAQGALAKAIAKLGADDWEMVGQAVFVSNGALDNHAIYFKRRK